MKDFLKTLLAVICGIAITTVILFVIGFGALGALASMGSSTPVLPKSGVLTLDLSKVTFGEQTQESDPFSSLTGNGEVSTIGIWDAVTAIDRAATDPVVEYIYIRPDGNGSSLSALEELREALVRFRDSGKAIVSYIESPGMSGYYIASVSDKIYMSSYLGATPQVNGVSLTMTFLGDLLKNLGIEVQLIRHGKYKSAGEQFTRSSASPENREQYERLVNSLWESMGKSIAESRSLSIEQLNGMINNLELNLPQDFVDCGLADELLDRAGLEEKLATLSVKDSYKDVEFIPFADYVSAGAPLPTAKQNIAVIYAEGSIVDGSGSSDVAGDRFANIIAKVRADSTVKAVVLRVNSPGGSVMASEKIKAELDRLAEVKPLVASYGDYAASGGYWISNNCSKIYSDATTLTGSIGVFATIPNFQKLTSEKLHVGIETVSSHDHGDMLTPFSPLSNSEYNYMLESIEAIYDRFTSIVSEGRGIPQSRVDEIGQGRVWSGADAVGLHLVDEVGTLRDAIGYAALSAGDPDLANWNVTAYPKPQNQMQQLLSKLTGGSGDEEAVIEELKATLSEPRILARMDMNVEIH